MAERLRDPNEVPGYDSTMRNVGNTIAHQAAALLVSLAEAVEWRPIETAPKDTSVLVLCDGDGIFVTDDARRWAKHGATHWAQHPPRSAPPASAEGEKG